MVKASELEKEEIYPLWIVNRETTVDELYGIIVQLPYATVTELIYKLTGVSICDNNKPKNDDIGFREN